MATEVFGDDVTSVISDAQQAALSGRTKTVTIDGSPRQFLSPFPSPGDWRDCWIYFLLLDRFNNPNAGPRGTWNQRFDFRQGGTLEGVRKQLGYLEQLGAKAIWISPVLKNSRPPWQYNYHGYGIQDFLNIDERFASDGTRATAERELTALVDEAHARGMRVVLDIVVNHTARVFDYALADGLKSVLDDERIFNFGLDQNPDIEWLNGFGFPRSDWKNTLPDPSQLSVDDAVWPVDLQRADFFRRRGNKRTDDPGPYPGFARGDFGDMRQMIAEYNAGNPGQESLRAKYGLWPVLAILIRAHSYLMARYDFDGYRIDTVKYVHPDMIEVFGNAMREFALSIGKQNFFTYGEIYDNEDHIAQFTGRNGGSGEGYGIDAALDFPLFYVLPKVAKGLGDVGSIRGVFTKRKTEEQELLSSHGEAGRFFVSFLDNHDQRERIKHPQTPEAQVKLALALLFTLQGIPSIYYGTEQGLQGTVDSAGNPDLNANESTREALWGKTPAPFDTGNSMFTEVQALSKLRDEEPPLRYGRFYFREVADKNGTDFGQSFGLGGLVAFSRILVDREVVVVANTNASKPFEGFVLIDPDIHSSPVAMKAEYSNLKKSASPMTVKIAGARIYGDGGGVGTANVAALPISLEPSEVKVFVPA
jgi:glycosidase